MDKSVLQQNFEILPKKDEDAFLKIFSSHHKDEKKNRSKSRTIQVLSKILSSTDSRDSLKLDRAVFISLSPVPVLLDDELISTNLRRIITF